MKRWKRLLKRFRGIALSYLPEAPDHRLPELALIRGHRVVPIATGEQAQAWWENPEEIGLSEEPYLSDPEY